MKLTEFGFKPFEEFKEKLENKSKDTSKQIGLGSWLSRD